MSLCSDCSQFSCGVAVGELVSFVLFDSTLARVGKGAVTAGGGFGAAGVSAAENSV